MNVLVTGGGGFLGLFIVDELLKTGYQVSSLSRKNSKELEHREVKFIQCDLSKENEVESLDLSAFDAVIHTAALAGVWGREEDFHQINYLGTKNLISVCKRDKIKYFIYTSSPSVVFEKEDILNGDESLPYPKTFLTFYAKTKAMAEAWALESNEASFLTMAIRPHLIWGPGDPHLIPKVLERARQKKLKRVGNGNNLVDIIYVENAAMAHVHALKALAGNSHLGGNAYFIGQEKPVKLWDFINQILTKHKMETVKSSVPFGVAYFVGYIIEKIYQVLGLYSHIPPMTRFIACQLGKGHYFSHEKASKDFGHYPKISIEEGLERYIKSYNNSLR